MLLLTTSDRVERVVESLIAYDDWNRILKGIVLLDKEGAGGGCSVRLSCGGGSGQPSGLPGAQ